MDDYVNENFIPLATLDKICVADSNAKEITRLIKRKNKVVGYEIANEFDVSVEQAIDLAKQGKIKNVGIAHNKNTVYLKSIPDANSTNNLSDLPTKK